jgi:LacI family transcriptional regulator
MPEKKPRTARQAAPTSVDVARRAGVSQAAVSYVLNGVQNTHVSQEVQAKIWQAAQELGYSIHPSARALRKGQSDEICLIADVPVSAHLFELFVAIQQQTFLHNLAPVLYVSHGLPPQQVEELLRRVFARRPMGIIATARSMTEQQVARARQMGVEQVVLISAEPAMYTPCIVLPSYEAGTLAAQHLLERGHHHLGLVHPDDAAAAYGFQQRLEGMRAIISQTPGATLQILPMHLSLSGARALIETFLDGPDHPTGIYAYNDDYALPLLRALADRKFRVPEDIAVLGTDNVSFGEFIQPALTTIHADNQAIGQRAVEMLLTLRSGQALPAELTRPLQSRLLIREST